MWSQTAAAVPAADATHTHRPPSLPSPVSRVGTKEKGEGREEEDEGEGDGGFAWDGGGGEQEGTGGRKREIAAIFPFLITLS